MSPPSPAEKTGRLPEGSGRITALTMDAEMRSPIGHVGLTSPLESIQSPCAAERQGGFGKDNAGTRTRDITMTMAQEGYAMQVDSQRARWP